MKWYYWLIIAIVIVVIIVLVVRSNKAKQAALNQIATNTANSEPFNPFQLSEITRKGLTCIQTSQGSCIKWKDSAGNVYTN